MIKTFAIAAVFTVLSAGPAIAARLGYDISTPASYDFTTETTCESETTYEPKTTLDGYYPLCGEVCEIDTDTNCVTVSDFSENLWQFYGIEDWQTGDICAMIMYDNNTEEIEDDIIVKIRYCGFH